MCLELEEVTGGRFFVYLELEKKMFNKFKVTGSNAFQFTRLGFLTY